VRNFSMVLIEGYFESCDFASTIENENSAQNQFTKILVECQEEFHLTLAFFLCTFCAWLKRRKRVK
jgi:hypothetical protein